MVCHYLQHVPFETPRAIFEWARDRGLQISGTRLFLNESLPESLPDFLIIMGGPMGVHDEDRYPWMPEEKAYIKKSIENGIKILGICLGAQLLAELLGAEVTKNPYKEIGWFPVRLTKEALAHPLFEGFPEEFQAFHWHGETFAIPKGAIPLAYSEACRNQAFLYQERILGLQFHLEMTPEGAAELLENSKEDLEPGPYVQNQEEILGEPSLYHETRELLFKLLDRFIRL
ncbi:type 1 glutamine amidotransferase [Thermosulfurimonas dismutans]|uniref:Glutamine amidotransferase class-I n=1 Tax=Thermosulfurimonas dismutans TaxID=999894 RepID=A0A179D5N5_9BACT|nr:type 1 glutamine amidotransferase [Thermosulfurimonas dismutans]OAQ21367.1 Glutamine amidotransferase class-I [Thermosulfurimonas dismutans]